MKIQTLNIASLLFFFFAHLSSVKAEHNIDITNETKIINIGSEVYIYEDASRKLTFQDVISKRFILSSETVPNLGISNSVFWIKINIANYSQLKNFMIDVSQPILDTVTFYYPINEEYVSIQTGNNILFHNRTYEDPNFLFNIEIPIGETISFYLKISSSTAIHLPIKVGTRETILSKIKNKDVLSGLYVGIMLGMIFFNLFIYISTREKSYIYYVFFILSILLTQTSLQGYTSQFLWPNVPLISKYSLFFLPGLAGVSGMLFMNVFLKTKDYSRQLERIAYFLILPYAVSFLLAYLTFYEAGQKVMEINAILVSSYMMGTGVFVLKKGYQPAKYFLVAWTIFLVGVVAYILKDFEILPYNNFTRYTMQIGSGIETVLLSFALAARINFYKKEKEKMQLATLELLKDNHDLIEGQKDNLEREVKERTAELEQTLNHLKNTQIQLVEAEKMSSLGQLTAGIAHEINNPINFVSSNIPPLKEDLKDLNEIIAKYEELRKTDNTKEKWEEIDALKKELEFDYLQTELKTIIGGIEDGANRTAAIVKGLKNFSRLDEEEIKLTKINDGIKSTVVLIRHKLEGVQLTKNLGDIPDSYCNPAKINQLIMNLIDNAIYAVHKKEEDNTLGKIKITTEHSKNSIKLTFSDNGVGIPKEVKDKLFEPFFTTKDVGEGTGLGMSIVKGIVDSHNGKINVETKLGEGTTITVEIPVNSKQDGKN